VLRGEPKTVIGTTDQVAGEFAIDLADLSTAQVGTLLINARTLATNNDFRNRAIQNRILSTNDFEFISFEPTSVDGLPDSVAVGEPVEFTITGQLTIRDISHEATFSVEATAVSESQITGTASTIVNRGDYQLVIPDVPNVANVEEQVELYIDFTADAS
jgi:polyisoprenoid-binding protein YceI